MQCDSVARQGYWTVKVVVEADGGSRGNPGPAGYGSVVWSADRSIVLAESKQAIGRATNNVAEYRGLIAGLEEAAKLDATEVAVSMDSKLVVEQMSGRWKVKHPELAELHAQAQSLAAHFEQISYRWIPRAENSHADRLANEAMDAAAALPDAASTVTVNETSSSPGWTGARGAATRLLLLRHGQTELSVQRRYSGRGNPPLTELGRQQAQAAARYLGARGGIAAVISSPLQRCHETATAAATTLGLDVAVDDDLSETDFGAWEGLTFAEAAEHDPDLHRRWLRDTSTEPPGGESFDHVDERVARARERIIADHAGSTVLVVSHVTPVKMLLREALDAGPGILYRLHLDLASLSIAEFYPDGASSVRLVNQTGYLG
jgi:broad specificity phosphatase PhoE/ribonuclease HI